MTGLAAYQFARMLRGGWQDDGSQEKLQDMEKPEPISQLNRPSQEPFSSFLSVWQ
jgi:hypothetical protein